MAHIMLEVHCKGKGKEGGGRREAGGRRQKAGADRRRQAAGAEGRAQERDSSYLVRYYLGRACRTLNFNGALLTSTRRFLNAKETCDQETRG